MSSSGRRRTGEDAPFATSRVIPTSWAPLRILIVRLSSLGDLLRFLPLASTLKQRFPGSQLSWAVGSRNREIVEMSRDVDRVLTLDADPLSPRRRWLPALARFAPSLRRRRYDVAIDAHAAPLSAAIVALCRAGRRLSIDKANVFGMRPFPYRALDPRSILTPIDYHLSVLGFFDIDPDEAVIDCGLEPGAEARRAAAEIVGSLETDRNVPLVAIHHDTSLDIKRWEVEKFAALANRLAREEGARVVVIGEGPSARLREIRRLCDPKVDCRHGLSLREMAALFERIDLVIAHDTGPLHLAAALDRPTVGIFGPSDPAHATPYGDRHRIVRREIPCSPCFRGFELRFGCPLGTKECLRSLGVDAVVEAARKALAGAAGAASRRDAP